VIRLALVYPLLYGFRMDGYDIFFSYRHTMIDVARPIVKSLRAQNLRALTVFFDETAIGNFEGITPAIAAGLAGAKVFVALYSKDYPQSRPY